MKKGLLLLALLSTSVFAEEILTFKGTDKNAGEACEVSLRIEGDRVLDYRYIGVVEAFEILAENGSEYESTKGTQQDELRLSDFSNKSFDGEDKESAEMLKKYTKQSNFLIKDGFEVKFDMEKLKAESQDKDLKFLGAKMGMKLFGELRDPSRIEVYSKFSALVVIPLASKKATCEF